MAAQHSNTASLNFVRIFRDLTVSKKLILLFSLFFAFGSVSLYVYLPARFEAQALRSMESKANSIVTITSYSAGPAFMFDDTVSFRETIESVRQDTQIAYIVFMGKDGRILSSHQLQAAEHSFFRTAKPDNHITADGLRLITYTEVRSQNRNVGELYMGFSLASLREEVANTRLSITKVSILLFVFGVLFVISISFFVTRPLAYMVEVVESITRGDFSKRAAVLSNDEIGHLAGSFNLMIDRLHTLNTDLETSNRELEDRVTRRTVDLRREVVEHQMSEAALKSSEKLLRSFAENFQGILFIVDRNGIFTFAEGIGLSELGLSSKQLVGRSSIELYGDITPVQQSINNALAGNSFTSVIQFGDFIYEVNFQPLHGDGDSITGILGVSLNITERERAQKLLRESDERLRVTLETSKIGTWDWDVKKDVWFASPTFYSMLGYEPVHGPSDREIWLNRVHPEDRPATAEKIKRVLNGTSDEYQYEARMKHTDGSYRWHSVIGHSIEWDEHKKPTRLIGVRIDITERKQAEEVMRKSEQQFRLVWENSADGMRLTDEHGIVLMVNKAFCRMVEKERSELEGKSLAIVYEKERYEHIVHRHSELFKTKTVDTHLEREITLWNGKKMWVEVTNSFLEIEGHQAMLLGIFRDNTLRKQTEKQAALLAHTLKSITECVSITDTNDIVIFVNDAFCNTYGYREEEILGHNISAVRSPNTSPEISREILPATLAGGWNGEVLNRTKDGRDFPVSLSTSYVHDEQGNIVALVGIAIDITDQKKLQQELLQSQKSESIGTLAGGIAHDFNNILGIILGYTSLLEMNVVSEEKRSESVAAISQAAKRGAALVRQILTFARKTEVSFEPLNLAELVHELVSMLQQTFPKVITFHQSVPENIPFVLADRTQIHQALLNLCVNARDAMPHGGSITINAGQFSGQELKEQFPSADHEWYVCISVTDTGEGMSEEIRRRVFDPFFTTKAKEKGTGLGLSVVYGVVQAHHGFVTVESEVGFGTIFRIYIPLPITNAKPVDSPPADSVEPEGTETVLLVEDEELLLDMVHFVLESKGYNVVAAHDGAEAVELFKKHRDEIAIVLTDMDLPKMKGNEAVKIMKEINPGVKVIFASGFFDPATKAELQSIGAKGFLQKPYLIIEILQTLRNALDN